MPPRPSSLKMTHLPSRSPIMLRIPDNRLRLYRSLSAMRTQSRKRLSLSYHFLESDTMESKRIRRKLMKTALLLIAHGSRNADANDDLFVLAEELRQTGTYAL